MTSIRPNENEEGQIKKPVKKDRFRWNLSIFHWCVDTNQRAETNQRADTNAL